MTALLTSHAPVWLWIAGIHQSHLNAGRNHMLWKIAWQIFPPAARLSRFWPTYCYRDISSVNLPFLIIFSWAHSLVPTIWKVSGLEIAPSSQNRALNKSLCQFPDKFADLLSFRQWGLVIDWLILNWIFWYWIRKGQEGGGEASGGDSDHSQNWGPYGNFLTSV